MPISKKISNARILALEVLHFCNPERTYSTSSAHLVNAAETFLAGDRPHEDATPEPEPFVEGGTYALEDLNAFRSAVADKRKINAIKHFRALFGCGLKDAKDCVEILLGEKSFR